MGRTGFHEDEEEHISKLEDLCGINKMASFPT